MKFLFVSVRAFVTRYFSELSLVTIAILVFGYSVISWLLMLMAGESALARPSEFIYWLVVTSSTVGYGDLSPETTAGKYVVSLWVIPVGLALFTLLITRVGTWMVRAINKGRMGMKHLNESNHIVVIGWNKNRTLRLLELLLEEAKELNTKVVLCVDIKIENPMPGKIGFVYASSFCHRENMDAACLDTARSIIIDTPQDDVTITTALFCNNVNPTCHKTAYFEDESLSTLLKKHCPNVECVPSVSLEMLAKATIDPGSSRLHRELLDPIDGMTQYSSTYDGSRGELSVRSIFAHIKENLNATLIGLQLSDSKEMIVNPSMDIKLNAGARVHYISDDRLETNEIFGFVEES